MTVVELLHRFLAYGFMGLVIEVLFTGAASLLQKNWRATCQTYLWMLPIYGVAGLLLDGLTILLHLHWYWMAPIYTAVIYGLEFISGWLLRKLIGRCPWDYGLSHWTPMGLINLKYLPFWLLLSCAYQPISAWLEKVVHVLASV